MTSSSAARRAPLSLAKRTGFFLGFLFICLFLSPARASDDLQEIKRCRSIIAEAAFLVELWSQGDVTDIFARGFLETAQEQLASSVDNPDLDARVRDEGQTHEGIAAIKAWKVGTSSTYFYTTTPIKLEKTGRVHVVTGHVVGNFPGSPVDLRYRFTLERGKISLLEITS